MQKGVSRQVSEAAPTLAEPRWTFVPMFSYSALSGGRQSWQEYDAQLYYKASAKLTLGGEVDVRSRRPAGTDTLLSALVFYTPWPQLELHGQITLAPEASFSAHQMYLIGFEAHPILKGPFARVSFPFDYQRWNYTDGSVDQIKPGITFWFTDDTFLSARIAHGWAYGDTEYTGFGGRFNLGLPGKRKLMLGYWHGVDPERDISTPKTINLPGDTYSLYLQQPIRRNCDLIVGIEHERHPRHYFRTTGALGVVLKF
jgi:YaiO family outer membrane protein